MGMGLRALALLGSALQQRLAGQPDLALAVHVQDLDHHFIPFLEDVRDRLHPVMSQLRDMDQAVSVGDNLHEGAEVHDLLDFALVNGADLGFGGKSP